MPFATKTDHNQQIIQTDHNPQNHTLTVFNQQKKTQILDASTQTDHILLFQPDHIFRTQTDQICRLATISRQNASFL
jgi:hypothetical protein